jgi:hypothetical protein
MLRDRRGPPKSRQRQVGKRARAPPKVGSAPLPRARPFLCEISCYRMDRRTRSAEVGWRCARLLEGVEICLTGTGGESWCGIFQSGGAGESLGRCRRGETRCPRGGDGDAPFGVAVAAPRRIDVDWRQGACDGPAVIKPSVERREPNFGSHQSKQQQRCRPTRKASRHGGHYTTSRPQSARGGVAQQDVRGKTVSGNPPPANARSH